MTTDQSVSGDERSDLSPGAILRSARESAGFSQEDVVTETRMTLLNVRALEADQYESLQSDTFIRGYLRIYAKMLKMDPAPLLDAYRRHRLNAGFPEEDEGSQLQIPVTPPGRPLWHFAVSILVLLAGLWVLSLWFLGNNPEPSADTGTDSVTELALGEFVPSEPEGDDAEHAEPQVPDESVQATTAAPVEAAQEGSDLAALALTQMAQASTPLPDALDRLDLSFSDECWLVVTDARGDVLYTDLVQPGRELSLDGQAPFDVKMGNAPAVQASLNGEPVALNVPAGARLMTVTVGD